MPCIISMWFINIPINMFKLVYQVSIIIYASYIKQQCYGSALDISLRAISFIAHICIFWIRLTMVFKFRYIIYPYFVCNEELLINFIIITLHYIKTVMCRNKQSGFFPKFFLMDFYFIYG